MQLSTSLIWKKETYSTFRFSFVEACKLTCLDFFTLKKIIKRIVPMLNIMVSGNKKFRRWFT